MNGMDYMCKRHAACNVMCACARARVCTTMEEILSSLNSTKALLVDVTLAFVLWLLGAIDYLVVGLLFAQDFVFSGWIVLGLELIYQLHNIIVEQRRE